MGMVGVGNRVILTGIFKNKFSPHKAIFVNFKLLNPASRTTRITLRDVARLAAVDVSTASLALRGSPKIAAQTAARIREAAAALNYRPDPTLAALNAYREGRKLGFRQVIAWLTNFPRSAGSWKARAIYAEYFEGASHRAEQCGYKLEEFAMNGGEVPPERMNQILKARGINALLLCPQPEALDLQSFDFSHFSAVTFGYSLRSPRLHMVSNHQFLSVQLAAEHLHAKGYRRIAIAFPIAYHESLLHQSDGAFLAFANRRESSALKLIYDDKEWSAAALNRWLHQTQPDALIADPNAMQGWWPQLDFKVPEDLGIASFCLTNAEQQWAGIYQNNFKIGVAGLDLLLMLLHRNETGVPQTPMRLLLEGIWREGASAPGPGRAAGLTPAPSTA